jgi:fumarate hydratase class II
MPKEIIRASAILKKAAALANVDAEVLSRDKAIMIGTAVCDEILGGQLDHCFPLVVRQTGSGTQSNMNVNEVIANSRARPARGKSSGREKTLSPFDDVNKSQSSTIRSLLRCILRRVRF